MAEGLKLRESCNHASHSTRESGRPQFLVPLWLKLLTADNRMPQHPELGVMLTPPGYPSMRSCLTLPAKSGTPHQGPGSRPHLPAWSEDG